MTVTIDSAGRIVVPKRLRDNLGLAPGSELELQEQNGSLTLTPANRQSHLVKRDGVWTLAGLPDRGVDWNKRIEEDREERIRYLAGDHS
jgi:AbrB family looped-hinge helix DNA binding protein